MQHLRPCVNGVIGSQESVITSVEHPKRCKHTYNPGSDSLREQVLHADLVTACQGENTPASDVPEAEDWPMTTKAEDH